MQSGDPYATCTHRQVSLLTFMSVCSFLHFCNIDVQTSYEDFSYVAPYKVQAPRH